MFDTELVKPRVVLASVDIGEFDIERSLDELEELVDTAGGEVVARVVQKKDSFDKAGCMGKGKLEELSELCEQLSVDQVIFNHELTGTQIRNIENVTNTHTIDRTMLILDIFAQRATSREGRIQVELAQSKYRMSRLVGMGVQLSRLGAGIGTRGPGESKLETDRRHIRTRVYHLEDELKEIAKRREFSRSRRKKDGVLVAAIVGYTNVGKSTLLNTLTEAGVLAENKLFATLETTSRGIELTDGRTVVLVDTVGLIRRLPHHLVEAFKSTLEEATSADVILHICDASADDVKEQSEVTMNLLKELGSDQLPVITVLNKCDLVPQLDETELPENTVKISAKYGTGIDELLENIRNVLPVTAYRLKLLIPYEQSGLVNKIMVDGKVFEQQYQEDGILVDALVDVKLFSKIEMFKLNK